MATNRVTLQLSDESLQSIQAHVASGEFNSEADVIETALFSLDVPPVNPTSQANLPEWFIQEAIAAAAELDAHPERALTAEQVEQYLIDQRRIRPQVE